jgi:hypothetical protein
MAFPADKLIGDHLLTKTKTAGEDLIGNRFVKVDTTDDTLVYYADAGEAGIGVNRETVKAGQLVNVVLAGTAFVTTAANIAAGEPVAAAADGKADVATTANQVLGRAFINANSGDAVLVVLGVGGIF